MVLILVAFGVLCLAALPALFVIAVARSSPARR